MKTANNGDLESLCFDGEDGVADWQVRPHPRIWGRNPQALPDVLHRSPDQRTFKLILLASHLLWPTDTPSWAKPLLGQTATDLLGAELALLEMLCWRQIFVPVAAGELGRLHVALVGSGETVPDSTSWNARVLADDSRRALDVARWLARLHARHDSCFLFLCSASRQPIIEGDSLGLPCYLGAVAAAGNLSCGSILATGRLDKDGQVHPVEYLSHKLDAAGQGFTLFLHPAGCGAPGPAGLECVPVTHVREALEIMACGQPGMNLKIAHAEQVLQAGQGMAREICSFRSPMATWVWRNRDRVAMVLQEDPGIEELVPHLQKWTDSTLLLDVDLGNAVLDCLPVERIRDRKGLSARAVWEICVLQMTKANHRGDLASLQIWTDLANSLRSCIGRHDDCGRMLTLHFVQRLIGGKHNRFEFSGLTEDHEVAEEVRELEMAYDRHCARHGSCSSAVLGKYYGTLGQHYGFLGPNYLEQALATLDKAIVYFHGEEKEQRQERDRDRLYQVFALSSAGRVDEAERVLRELENLWRDGAWNGSSMNPYQLHALLRLHVDAGRAMDSVLWHEIREKWQQGPLGHPSQLISYNLGLLAKNSDMAIDLLRHSSRQCLADDSGPTIRVMALLPLARLYEIQPSDRVVSTQVDQALEPIRNGSLSTEHFRFVLDAGGWADVLSCVVKRRTELFPFSYR